jgi:hypothetical protein
MLDRRSSMLDSSGLQPTSGSASSGKVGGRTLTDALPEVRSSGGSEGAAEALQRLEKNLEGIEPQTQRLTEAISSRQFLLARSTSELIRILRKGVDGALADAKRLGGEQSAIAPLETRWARLAQQVTTLVEQAPAPSSRGLDVLGLGHADEEERWLATLGSPSGASAAATRDAHVDAADEALDLDAELTRAKAGGRRRRGAQTARQDGASHELKESEEGPVFASNELPYQVSERGVWVIRDWVMAAPDLEKKPRGLLAPSRARRVLEAVAWVEPSRIEWAAANLLFVFSKRIDLLRFGTEAFHVTGLPQGTDAVASRGGRRGLDVVVALEDPKLIPGGAVAFTEMIFDKAVAAVTNLTGLPPDLSGLEMLATEPAFQKLKVGNGTVLLHFDEELCDGLFGTEAYQRWAGGKVSRDKAEAERPPEQGAPKLALSNFYQQPVPGTLTNSGEPIESNEQVWFEVVVAWPTHFPDPSLHRAPPMATPGHRGNVALLQCEWEIERLSEDADRRRSVETARSSVAELRHSLKLDPGESIGRFRITARTRFDEYFAPAEFSKIVVVRSTEATMAKLRSEAFGDLQPESEQRTPESFADRTRGSGSDIHGTRTSGALPSGFVSSPAPARGAAVDPRAAARSSETQRLQATRMYLAAQGPRAVEALQALDRELAARRASERSLAGDRAKRWQPFEIRGTYLAREEGLASGPLSLYGTVHIERVRERIMDGDEVAPSVYEDVDYVVVQVRDLSRRFDPNDLTFIGRGSTFDAALRDAFVDLAKAYPKGVISVLAEQIDGDAVARANGSAGPAGGGENRLGTGKAIGFELGTDSTWKRARATVWDPAVNIAVNLGAIALMAFVPGSAIVVAPMLAVYNSAQAVDRIASESARGTLTAGTFAMSVGEIALNVLPMVGQAKKFTAGWFAIETANWGGQVLLMTAGALQAARDLQGRDVAALAALYQELQALEADPKGNAAALEAARAEIMARAKAVSDRIHEQMWEQVKSNALVAVAGSVVHHATAQAKAQMMEEFAQKGGAQEQREGTAPPAGAAPRAAQEPRVSPSGAPGTRAGASGARGEGAAEQSTRASAPHDDASRELHPSAMDAAATSPVTGSGSPPPGRLAALRAELPADLHDLPIVENQALRGKSAQVRYRDGDIVLEIGPEVAPRQVRYHIGTAQCMLRYRGPLGQVRRLIDRLLNLLRLMPGYGTAGFEARAEVKKLRAIEADVQALRRELADGASLVENGKALTDAELASEMSLVAEQLAFHERRLDSFERGSGVVAAHAPGDRVTEMVPGLYESIDPNVAPEGWKFEDEYRGEKLVTKVTDPNGITGMVWRGYDASTRTWVMDAAFFSSSMSRWIPSDVEMVSGKGTPLLAYLDMRQMRMRGIDAGGISMVKLSTIQNSETVCQLHKLLREGMPLHEAIHLTHSVSYATTEIVQSGHRIAKIEVVGGKHELIDNMMRHYEQVSQHFPIDRPTYRSPKQHDEILRRYGVRRDEVVYWNFDIKIHTIPKEL